MATGTLPQPVPAGKILSIDITNGESYVCNTLRKNGGAAFILGWVRAEGIVFLALTHLSGVVTVVDVMTGQPYSSDKIGFSVTSDGYLEISYITSATGHHQLLVIGN